MIRHLLHHEIDKALWDARLLRCVDRLWYMQSWVLDRCSPGWEALVDEETGALMPLLWRRKLGLDYLHQPYTIQQQGVFSPTPGKAISSAFLEAVPRRFRYWDIHLNARMELDATTHDRISPNKDQELLLAGDIASLRAGYSQGHRRNLRKCGDHPPVIAGDISGVEFVALFQRTTAVRFGGVPAGGLQILEGLIAEGTERGQCRILGVREAGSPVAAVCFMEWEGRSILLKSANDTGGSDRQAMFHLVDRYISEHAGSGVVLDFAGSNTASVARFNEGFGARTTVYLHLVRNRLPPPLRWIKR